MSFEYFIGIDPGNTGAVAVLDCHRTLLEVHNMPETRQAFTELFMKLKQLPGPTLVILEQVAASPRMGPKQAYTFGREAEKCMLIVVAYRFLHRYVRPITWQTFMGCRSGGDKKVTLKKAKDIFPGVKVTKANADALLIADYGRMYYGSKHSGQCQNKA